MADATMDFLERFNDPTQWVVVRAVPIFRPHVRMEQGKEKYRVTEQDLPVIGANARRKEAETGVVGRLTIGHTAPGVPESQQPVKLVGYVRNQREGGFGPEGQPCELCDLWYERAHWDEARRYPFRSAEYWPGRKEITGVALLIRDPELDLGMVAYSQADTDGPYYIPESYMAEPSEGIDPAKAKKILEDDSARGHPLTEKQRGMFGAAAGRSDNERGTPMADPTMPPTSTPPAPKPAAPEVDPKLMQMLSKCMAEYMAGGGAGAAPAAPAAAPAVPGPTNGTVPIPPKKEEPAAAAPYSRQGDPDLLSRTDALVQGRLAEQQAAFTAQLQAMREENEATRLKARRAEISVIDSQLSGAGYQYDRQDFVETCVHKDDAGVEATVKRIMTFNRQDPARNYGAADQDPLSFTMQPGGLPSFSSGAKELTQDQLDRQLSEARMYERQGMSWDEATKKAQGNRLAG